MNDQGMSEKYTHCECGTAYDGVRYFGGRGVKPICSACYSSIGTSAEIDDLRSQLAAAKAEGERVRDDAMDLMYAAEKRAQVYMHERDALAGLLDEAREFVAEVVEENAAKWGDRVLHKQKPAAECLERIDAALAIPTPPATPTKDAR